MRNKIKKRRFIHIIYFALAIIAIESVFYFLQAFTSPKISFAQEPDEIKMSPTAYITRSFRLPILIYHYVEYVTDERDTIRKSLNIEPHIFEAQIKSLRGAGYTFITPAQISQIETGRIKIEKPVILSFDDGYRDFYTDVFPILKKHNIRAVAYVNPGLLGKLNYMYHDQVREIAQSGLVEIGSHGVSHRSLISLDLKQAEWEIVESKSMLEKELGITITSVAYPYGHYNNAIAELAKSAGYASAITTDEGVNENTSEKFTLKRIHPGARIGSNLIYQMNLIN